MDNQLSHIQEEELLSFSKDILAKETISTLKKILNTDRLQYVKILQKWGPMSNAQVTQIITALNKRKSLKEINEGDIKNKKPNVYTRLVELEELGILNKKDQNFSISPVGFFLINLMEIIEGNINVLIENKQFLDFHDYKVIPSQEISRMSNLQFSNQCTSEIEYSHMLEEKTGGVTKQIKIITDRLHDIPKWIRKEITEGNITFKLIYQFKNPFRINSNDEDEYRIWNDLLQDTIKGELKFLSQDGESPLGIRIIDDEWALLNFYEFTEQKLNRSRSFYGDDTRFVSWIIDIFWNYWDNANSLTNVNIGKIRNEIEK
jgi:predicted transcriptional regulator